MPTQSIAPARLSGKSRRAARRVLMPQGRRAQRARPTSPATALRAFGLLAAAILGIACGIFDLRTGRSETTALLLGGAAMLFALGSPLGAVPRAVVLGACIPLVYFVATLLDLTIPYPPVPHYAATAIAVVPALAGALLGLALRHLVPDRGPRRRLHS